MKSVGHKEIRAWHTIAGDLALTGSRMPRVYHAPLLMWKSPFSRFDYGPFKGDAWALVNTFAFVEKTVLHLVRITGSWGKTNHKAPAAKWIEENDDEDQNGDEDQYKRSKQDQLKRLKQYAVDYDDKVDQGALYPRMKEELKSRIEGPPEIGTAQANIEALILTRPKVTVELKSECDFLGCDKYTCEEGGTHGKQCRGTRVNRCEKDCLDGVPVMEQISMLGQAFMLWDWQKKINAALFHTDNAAARD